MSTQYAKVLTDLLKANALEVGTELKGDLVAAEAYAAQVMTELSAAVGEPSYSDALIAARDDVALKYAGIAVEEADNLDSRLVGIITGALGVATSALTRA